MQKHDIYYNILLCQTIQLQNYLRVRFFFKLFINLNLYKVIIIIFQQQHFKLIVFI